MPLELLFLGTGTSSCLPNIACLTEPSPLLSKHCHTCHSKDPRDRRRNTGAVIRKTGDGRDVTIVIDAGKSFISAALEWFPKYGLRTIDALLLTHAHADAMNGLDDLRSWTLRSMIQPKIPIYAAQRTLDEVGRTFPYLVDKGQATGGGDVPDFEWHVIEEGKEYDICGIKVLPILVHHGQYFESAPSAPSRSTTRPGTPASPPITATNTPTLVPPSAAPTTIPYPSLSFLFPPNLYYISDISSLPAPSLALLSKYPPPRVLVCDCLRPAPHTSHFGLAQAVDLARTLKVERTYWVGFSCSHGQESLTNWAWERIGAALGDARADAPSEAEDAGESGRIDAVVALVPPGESVWARPAFDGLRVWVDDNGGVRDEGYDA